MNAHTILEIGAWTFGALAVLLLSGGFVLGPAGERAGGHLYRRETRRIEQAEADERQRLLMARLNEAAKETAEPGAVPAPDEPERPSLLARLRRPVEALKARNEAILKEREARRG